MKLGYARVSTEDQNLEIQRGRLSEAGCEMMFEEKISGAARGRPELEKLMGHLRKDDVLVVARLDLQLLTRLAGNARNSRAATAPAALIPASAMGRNQIQHFGLAVLLLHYFN